MSEPRVARLDDPASEAAAAEVADLGEVTTRPAGPAGAAVADLGAVLGAGPAAVVADLDAVGRADRVGGSDPDGSVPDGSGPGEAGDGSDRDGSDRDGSGGHGAGQHGAGRSDGGGLADLGAIAAATPAPVRLARLDGAAPRRSPRPTGRTEPGREPAPADTTAPRPTPRRPTQDGTPDTGDDRRRRGRSRTDEPATEDGDRPARARRPPGPRQIDPDADPVAAAREICLRLLTDRARTRTELAQALARRGVPAEAAEAVLERFDEVGLIDDAAFAGQWVRSRHRHRGLARRAIAQELRRKGVDDEVAGEALAEVDGESEARRARELVDRKLRTLPAGTPEQRATAARKLVGMLARRGYGAGVAYGVVKEALAEHGADPDETGGDEMTGDEPLTDP